MLSIRPLGDSSRALFKGKSCSRRRRRPCSLRGHMLPGGPCDRTPTIRFPVYSSAEDSYCLVVKKILLKNPGRGPNTGVAKLCGRFFLGTTDALLRGDLSSKGRPGEERWVFIFWLNWTETKLCLPIFLLQDSRRTPARTLMAASG